VFVTIEQEEFAAWRQARWEELAGPHGKARVVAKGWISGADPQLISGVPGQWSTTPDGALRLTATGADEIVVGGRPVTGPVEVPAGSRVEFPEGLTATVMGGNGAYGVVVMDDAAVARSGLIGIETYPYDTSWVLQGEYRAASTGRTVEVDRLTVPRSRDTLPAPVDLAITIGGEERVLTILEDMPGHRLLIFTDETNGSGTSELGRWLLLPLVDPGSSVTVDFNRTILSHHHISPAVFTCPTEPEGNHLPLRVEAGERALIYQHEAPSFARERLS
jgi:uncharacterized protein (DUF1684 family)